MSNHLRISARVHTGDYDREYAHVTIGDATVTIYESVMRPGGVTVEIDCNNTDSLGVFVNDSALLPT